MRYETKSDLSRLFVNSRFLTCIYVTVGQTSSECLLMTSDSIILDLIERYINYYLNLCSHKYNYRLHQYIFHYSDMDYHHLAKHSH